MLRFRLLLSCSLLFALAALPALAVTLSPGQSIQEAITAASDGDVIILSPGVYNECIDFAGKNLVIRSTDATNPSVVATTIIDGGGSGRVVTFNNGEGATAMLKGLTIRNGGGTGVIGGGGIFCRNASPKITNNLIVGNILNAGSGGGILVNGGAPTINQNIIRGNVSPAAGGGVCFQNGATGLFLENSVMQNSGVYGGGLALYGSTPDVRKNSIQKNSAASSGGAVYISSAAAQLRYNSLHRNTAGLGAAVYATGSAWRLANCLLTLNTASSGAAIECAGGTVTLTSNTLVDNSAGVLTVDSGGSITNCIITGCTGLAVSAVGSPVPGLSYTDLYDNAGGSYSGVTVGKGLLSVDPLFVSPANSLYNLKSQAGHFQVGWVNDAVTSPCVDAGSPWLTCALEPANNGGRINMGFEGNTEQASKSIGSLVTSVSPANGAEGTSRRPQIVINFQRPVDQASAESHFDLYSGMTNPDGTFSWPIPNRRMIYTSVALGAGAPWTISLSSGIKLWDGTDTALPFTSHFMSGTGPVIVAATPVGTSVPRGTNIVVTFETPMGHGTTTRAFHITPAAPGAFRWALASQRLIFDPTGPLAADTTYRVTVDGTAKSMAGVAMRWAYAWSFTTAPAAPVQLRATVGGRGGAAAIAAALNEPAAVTVTISNVAGRLVARLPERQCDAGVSTLLWDGRAATGTPTPAGAYLVQVTARGADGSSSSCLLTLQK